MSIVPESSKVKENRLDVCNLHKDDCRQTISWSADEHY